MKLYYDRRLKDPTYYVQVGFRDTNGKATSRNVRTLGKRSDIAKITDLDPLEWAKREVQRMNQEEKASRSSFTAVVDFSEKIENSDSDVSESLGKNIGYFYLQYIYSKLELDSFFRRLSDKGRFTFDCDEINRFLTYSRIMYPSAKLSTWQNMGIWYENPDIQLQDIYRFMDVLEKHGNSYLSWLYKKSGNIVKRDTSVMYYDCTNYYFEAEQEDEDYTDEVTGETMHGLRKYGVSKENRPNPIVEMGLFMDRHGIPVSMCLDPGNTSEQVTAVPLEKEIMRSIEGSTDFIYCADAGLGSLNIRRFNAMGGRHFIVTQSVKKLSDQLKDAVFNDFDYRLLSTDEPVTIEKMKSFDRKDPDNLSLYNDYAYKVIDAEKAVDLGLYELKELNSGKTVKRKSKAVLKQKVIVRFSRKMMEYQRTVRNRQIERAKNLLKSKDPEEVKKGPNDVKRFLKREAKGKDGSKAAVTYILDMDKIHEEEKYDGYYAVATNLDSPVKEILAISDKRWQIEDCFRILKTNFDARPVYHYKPERIRAHFLICYTSLLVYRLLEVKMNEHLQFHENAVSVSSMTKTLQNLNVIDEDGKYWRAAYKGSSTLTKLVRTTGIDLTSKYYQPKELNKLIRKI